MNETLTHDRILEAGLGFMASKALLSAVEMGIFTQLAKAPADLATLAKKFELHPRSAADFLDLLVAMKFLERDNGIYRNSPESARFLDRNHPDYVGGILEMCNSRLYGHWSALTEALHTGQQQNETRDTNNTFEKLYSDPDRLESFLKAMTGISKHSARAIAQKFEWTTYRSFLDVGAAQGAVPVELALAHRHLVGSGLDLPQVRPIFQKYVQQHGLSERVSFCERDFFKDNLPQADVIIMGHILHDWGIDHKRMLLKKAYDAVPRDGAVIVYDLMIDNDRRTNVSGFLMSLNMLIETPAGFDYTTGQCEQWMKETGFRETRVIHLAAGDWMVVGIK